MNGGLRITNMPEFQRTLREYAEVSKRDDKTIVATKMFYIARGAARNTYRTPKAKVKQELSALFNGQSVRKAKVWAQSASGISSQVPLAALIINAARGRRGQPGLYGAEMAEAQRKFAAARLRSVAFIAAGWLPAIKRFEPLAERKGGAPPRDSAVKQFGPDKGRGFMAGTQLVPMAVVENFAQGKEKSGAQALDKYATEGLDKAFAHEMASMREYIEDRKQKTANRYNAR